MLDTNHQLRLSRKHFKYKGTFISPPVNIKLQFCTFSSDQCVIMIIITNQIKATLHISYIIAKYWLYSVSVIIYIFHPIFDKSNQLKRILVTKTLLCLKVDFLIFQIMEFVKGSNELLSLSATHGFANPRNCQSIKCANFWQNLVDWQTNVMQCQQLHGSFYIVHSLKA